jgi:hypothetical protein
MSTFNWSPWISPLAEELARQLTVKYSIREGFGLAIYLGINRCYKNHHAVRIWIQRMLDKDKHNDSLESLNSLFLAVIPSDLLS